MKRPAVLLLSLLLSLAGAWGVSGQSGESPLALLINQLVSLFPKVEGEVLETQGDTVTLTVGRRDGVQPGLDLALYREGRELRHPRTGQLLGRAEQPLGRVVIEQAFEAYSTGKASAGSGARPGDKVRVSSGRIKVTVVPVVDGVKGSLVEAAVHEFVEGLNRTGRFQAISGDQITAWLARERISPSVLLTGERMGDLVRSLGVEHLVSVHFTLVQRKPYMDVRLFSGARRDPLLSTALFVPATIKPPAEGGFSTGGQPRAQTGPKPKQSLLARLLGGDLETGAYSSGESSIRLHEVVRLGFPVLTMDVAVSPHDGVPRIVITDGSRIYLYRIVNRALEAEWTYLIRSFGTIMSLQLADLDGDGQLEVIVNRHYPPIGMLSTILSAKGGKPAPLADEINDLILLAVDDSGAGVKRTLWGQRYNREQFFTVGQADRFTVRKGGLVSEGRVPVPETFRATGAAFSNVNGKASPRVLAYVDQHQRLRIASGNEELWRSSSPVGGGYIIAEVQGSQTFGPQPKPATFHKMEPFPISVDLDGDGIEEIVLPQNQNPGMLVVIYRGPTGFRLQSVNSGFEGAVTALGAIPKGEGDAPALIASVVRFTNFFKTSGETQIIMTTGE